MLSLYPVFEMILILAFDDEILHEISHRLPDFGEDPAVHLYRMWEYRIRDYVFVGPMHGSKDFAEIAPGIYDPRYYIPQFR